MSRRALLVAVPAVGAFAGAYRLTGDRIPQALQGDEVSVKPVREGEMAGKIFLPANPKTLTLVITLAGASGGTMDAASRALASDGFTTFALATHNYEGRPSSLRMLPIEYVVQAAAWLRRFTGRGQAKVVLRGWSRGGELALLAASLSPTISGVMAYAPRCYVGRENGKQNDFANPGAAPAFTWQDRALDGVPLPDGQRMDPANPTLEELHGIPVERIAGPIMFVSGSADTAIAGTTAVSSCNQAVRRLHMMGFKHAVDHHTYPGAGHNIAGPPPFAGPIDGGGSWAADSVAVSDSWAHSLHFLHAISGA